MDKANHVLQRVVSGLQSENIDNSGVGLLTGKSGIAMFLFYLSRVSKEPAHAQKAGQLVGEVFQAVNAGYNFPTYCDGMAGFAWSLEHLAQQQFIAREDIGLLHSLDPFLYRKMMQDIRSGWYDFLHGSMGIALYFLERRTPEASGYVKEFIGELDRHSRAMKGGGVAWTKPLEAKNKAIGVDLGIAHGMSGIILFLAKVVARDRLDATAFRLLKDAVKFVLDNRVRNDDGRVIFPSLVVGDTPEPGRRIGWCYGDLAVAYALYKAAIALDDAGLQQGALQALRQETDYSDLYEDYVDCSICHGAAGIAHVFNRLYRETGAPEFRGAAQRWFGKTFRMVEEELEGKAEEYDYGILGGHAGIGLALLTLLSEENLQWDACLLLT